LVFKRKEQKINIFLYLFFGLGIKDRGLVIFFRYNCKCVKKVFILLVKWLIKALIPFFKRKGSKWFCGFFSFLSPVEGKEGPEPLLSKFCEPLRGTGRERRGYYEGRKRKEKDKGKGKGCFHSLFPLPQREKSKEAKKEALCP